MGVTFPCAVHSQTVQAMPGGLLRFWMRGAEVHAPPADPQLTCALPSLPSNLNSYLRVLHAAQQSSGVHIRLAITARRPCLITLGPAPLQLLAKTAAARLTSPGLSPHAPAAAGSTHQGSSQRGKQKLPVWGPDSGRSLQPSGCTKRGVGHTSSVSDRAGMATCGWAKSGC